jgi:glycosyltransferase involved in cell wall biosynthesis
VTVGYLLERYPVVSQTFVSNEVAELRRQGVDVVVASLWAGDPAQDETPTIIISETHPRRRRAVADHLSAFARHPIRYLRFLAVVRSLGDERRVIGWRRLPSLARELRGAGVDRLHAHFAWGGAAVAAAIAALTGWPWAMTVHARDIFTDRRNLELKLQWTDQLITVCDYNRRFLVERLGYRGPISIVVCGVEPPARPRGEPDLGVIFVGRMVEKKGVDVLLHAIAELLPTTPDLRLDLVGDGPLLEPMRSLATSLGLTDVVRFHGETAHADTLDLIARATVLCLPARVATDGDVDSMPVVVKEAMIRGVAVAGCDVGGVAEMLADGCGELVSPDDPAALAVALRRLLADQNHRASCTARAYDRARQSFVLSDQVARLKRVFDDLPSS